MWCSRKKKSYGSDFLPTRRPIFLKVPLQRQSLISKTVPKIFSAEKGWCAQ
jgi:hypothetical protein